MCCVTCEKPEGDLIQIKTCSFNFNFIKQTKTSCVLMAFTYVVIGNLLQLFGNCCALHVVHKFTGVLHHTTAAAVPYLVLVFFVYMLAMIFTRL